MRVGAAFNPIRYPGFYQVRPMLALALRALCTPVRHRWLENTNCHRPPSRPIYIFFALIY